MSFSYNNVIDHSKNEDIEKNKKFNTIIYNANNKKKKSSQEEINNMMNKLSNKIFDVIIINNEIYFFDKESKYIWNNDIELVGIKSNNELYLWSDIDYIFNIINEDNTKIKNILN
jgi:septum formation inhibitor-activating ATPase MinD